MYLDPQAHGAQREQQLTMEGTRRLGLEEMWSPVYEACDELKGGDHHLEFIALDLGRGDCRTKVYFRHGASRFSSIDAIASLAKYHDSDGLREFSRLLYGEQFVESDEILTNEPMTCLALRSNSNLIEEANVYLRLPGMVRSDADAMQRTAAILAQHGVRSGDHLRLMSALSDLAPVDLNTVFGIREFLSYRSGSTDKSADIGIYLRFSMYA